jgi:hypothetical protein
VSPPSLFATYSRKSDNIVSVSDKICYKMNQYERLMTALLWHGSILCACCSVPLVWKYQVPIQWDVTVTMILLLLLGFLGTNQPTLNKVTWNGTLLLTFDYPFFCIFKHPDWRQSIVVMMKIFYKILLMIFPPFYTVNTHYQKEWSNDIILIINILKKLQLCIINLLSYPILCIVSCQSCHLFLIVYILLPVCECWN